MLGLFFDAPSVPSLKQFKGIVSREKSGLKVTPIDRTQETYIPLGIFYLSSCVFTYKTAFHGNEGVHKYLTPLQGRKIWMHIYISLKKEV